MISGSHLALMVLAISGIAPALHAAVSTVRYQVTPIALPADLISASAGGINNEGTVLISGTSGDTIRFRTYTYSAGEGLVQISPGESISASGLNDVGQIVGNSFSGGIESYIYSQGTGLREIRSIGAPYGANPAGVNNSGLVIGASTLPGEDKLRAFIWDSVSDAISILDPSLTYYSMGAGINNAGWAVGEAWIGPTVPVTKHAFRYSPTEGFSLLPGLGGSYAAASAINDANVAAGVAIAAGSSQLQAVMWDASGTLIQLGALGGGDGSALGINNLGQIVGTSNNRAFIYEDGEMRDLNPLLEDAGGILLRQAVGINDRGQILATYGTRGIVLLTPVPEPGAFLLTLTGFIMLLSGRRRAPR